MHKDAVFPDCVTASQAGGGGALLPAQAEMPENLSTLHLCTTWEIKVNGVNPFRERLTGHKTQRPLGRGDESQVYFRERAPFDNNNFLATTGQSVAARELAMVDANRLTTVVSRLDRNHWRNHRAIGGVPFSAPLASSDRPRNTEHGCDLGANTRLVRQANFERFVKVIHRVDNDRLSLNADPANPSREVH